MSLATVRSQDAPDIAPPRRQPPEGLLAIGRRYWYVVLLCALVFGGLATAWALQRAPTYTAEARVGSINLRLQNIAAIPGVLDAANDVTTLYARSVQSDQVLRPVAKANDLSLQEASNAVTATPLADTPIVRIAATAKSERRAVAIVGDTASSLVRFVRSQTGLSDNADAQLQRYRELSLRAAELDEEETSARDRLALADTPANRRQVAAAAAATAEAQLLADTQRTEYETTLQNRHAALAPVKLTAATALGNDRNRVAQMVGLAGVVGGAAVGIAIAGLLAARRRRKQD